MVSIRSHTEKSFNNYKNHNEKYLLKYIAIITIIAILSSLIIISKSILITIISFLILTISLVFVVKFEILHPYVWFNPFFMIYSISYPLLVYLGEQPDFGLTFKTLILEWIALVTFVIVVGPKKECININAKYLKGTKQLLRILLIIMLIFTWMYTAYIFFTGLSSKTEIALSTSLIIRFAAFFPILILIYALYIANEVILEKSIPVKLIIFIVTWMVISFLISGERDFVYRIIWVSIFLIDSIYKKIPKRLLLLGGMGGLISIPILGNMKNILVSDKSLEVFMLPTMTQILSEEFISASRNLNTLLLNSSSWDWFMGKTLWWDFKRIFVPQFLTTTKITNPVGWFNNYFYAGLVNRGGGRGFTLVGEGYMNFGTIGVIIWFILFGLIIRFIYRRSTNNIIILIIYIVFMPTVTYAIRADFSNLLSPLFSQILIPLIIIYVGKTILNKNYRI